jgi:predicted nucleotidyltransferase
MGYSGKKIMTDPILEQDPKLAEIARRLVSVLRPERIYLFGSVARGERGAASDYDILVLVQEASEPLYRLSQKAHALLWDLNVSADILVWPLDLFDRRAHLRASLPATVLREGRLLYAR